MKNRFLLFSILFCLPYLLTAGITDSLEQVLKTKKGKDRIKLMCDLSEEYAGIDNKRAEALAREAINMAVDAGDDKLIIEGNSSMGYFYDRANNYPEALKYYQEALRIAERSNDSLKIGVACTNVGRVIFADRGDLKSSMDYYLRAIEIYKLKGEKKRQARTMVNIANLLATEGNYDGALKYYQDALPFIDDDKARVTVYNNIAASHVYKKDNANASIAMKHSLAILEKMPNAKPDQLAIAYNNLGSVMNELNDSVAASIYLEKALVLNMQQGDSAGIAMNLFNIGNVLLKKNSFKDAEDYMLRAYGIMQRQKDKQLESDMYHSLAKLYSKTNRFEKAFEFQQKYIETREKSLTSGLTDKLERAGERFEAQQRDMQAQKENAVLEERNKQKNIFILLLVAGALLLVITAFLLFRRFRDKKKANEILENRNITIEAQKFQIEQKNKEITDSIRYAQRLQDAVLPDERSLLKLFPESFLLFMPKDIVSGDFFWCAEKNGYAIVAVADCTGHGVPGALLSMIGNNLLHREVHEHGLTDPGKILHGLNSGLQQLLAHSQSDTETAEIRDGMDIALVVIHKATRQLTFAGANRPLLIIRNSTITELQPSRKAIGSSTAEDFVFETQTFALETGDLVLAFTDGYADQFGGGKGKKMMLRTMKDQLLKHAAEPVTQQKEKHAEYFRVWRGELEQVDDVLVAGIRV